MKRFLTSCFVFINFIALPLFGFEWGGVVGNTTKVTSSDFEIFPVEQSNNVNLWFNAALSSDSKWYLSSEAMYRVKAGFYGKETEPIFSNVIDLNLLKLNGTFEFEKGILSLSAGRFFISDNTGIIFDQVSDGLFIKYGSPAVILSGYFGYTGLLNALNVSMLAPKRDELGLTVSYPTKEEAKIYTLSHKFLPFEVSAEFPTIFGNQALSMQFNGFLDVEETQGIEKANRYYFDLGLRGPIAGSFYYSAISSLGTTDFKSLMNYSKLQLLCYPTRIFNFKIGAEYASGNAGEVLKTFTGFTSNTAYNSLSSPEYGGQLLPAVNFVISNKIFYFDIGGKVVLLVPDTQLSFSGFEADFSSIVNIFSDLQLGLGVTAFVDLNEETKGAQSYYTATVNLKLTF